MNYAESKQYVDKAIELATRKTYKTLDAKGKEVEKKQDWSDEHLAVIKLALQTAVKWLNESSVANSKEETERKHLIKSAEKLL